MPAWSQLCRKQQRLHHARSSPRLDALAVRSYTEPLAAPQMKGNCSQVAVDLNSLKRLEKEMRTTWFSWEDRKTRRALVTLVASAGKCCRGEGTWPRPLSPLEMPRRWKPSPAWGNPPAATKTNQVPHSPRTEDHRCHPPWSSNRAATLTTVI